MNCFAEASALLFVALKNFTLNWVVGVVLFHIVDYQAKYTNMLDSKLIYFVNKHSIIYDIQSKIVYCQ